MASFAISQPTSVRRELASTYEPVMGWASFLQMPDLFVVGPLSGIQSQRDRSNTGRVDES